MKILIIKLSAIGDVVQTLPALEAIKLAYPASEITWVVEEAAAGILEGHPGIHKLLVSRRKAWFRMLWNPFRFFNGLRGIFGFFRELRRSRYDIAIDFQGLFKSGILIGLARAKRKVGYDGTREHSSRFLNEKLAPYDKEKHALDRYLDIARYLGATKPAPVCMLPIENEIATMKERIAALVSDGGLLVAVNPVARWTTKLWSEQRFAELADRLIAERRAVVVFTGSADDRAVTGRICAMMKHKAENWAGETTLKELAALASRADLFITTDTGPMHLAAAAGARVLALFGPTAPWRTGPYGDSHHVIRTGIACSPCFQRKCDTGIACMEGISVEMVMNAVNDKFQSLKSK